MEEKTTSPLDVLRADYETHPGDGNAAARLAEHYTDLGWFNEALDVYREALKINPDDLSLLIGFGNTCFRHSDLREALVSFRRITELNPKRIEGWNNLGIVQMAMGDDDAARTAFGRVLAIEPDNAGALLNMGNCHARKGNAALARTFFERAMAVKPDYADGWFNLGNTYLADKSYQKAIDAFKKAITYQREFPSALKNMGYAYEQLGDWEMAAGHYRSAAALDKVDAGVQINLANACMALGQFEEARECFLKAVKLAPKNTAGWIGLRHIALMKGDLPTYRRATGAVLPHLSETVIAATIGILLGLQRLPEAMEIVAGADRLDKQSNELDAQRLLVYNACALEPARCSEIYKRLCALPPSAASVAIDKALAQYAFACGDFAAAKRHVRMLHRTDSAALGIVVHSHLALGEISEAHELLAHYPVEGPENGERLFLLACCELKEGQEEKARKDFVFALEDGYASIEELERYPAFKLIYDTILSGAGTARCGRGEEIDNGTVPIQGGIHGPG
jgi:Flp pilus assembly protein TadD